MKLAGIGVIATALSDDPRAAAAAARAAGFGGLQFDVASRVDLIELSVSGRREFRQVLSHHAQQLIALQSDVGTNGLQPGADIDRILWRMDKIIETAAGLGSPLVCLDLGALPSAADIAEERPRITPEQAGIILLPDPSAKPKPTEPPSAAPDPAFIAQVDNALVEIGRRADRYNVTVALRSSLASFTALKRALSAAACPWFGVDFDPVDALQDGRELDAIFSDFAGLIRHVRGRDAIVGDRQRTRPAAIGQGVVDWAGIFSRLEESSFTGWVTIDPVELPDRRGSTTMGRNHLARLITA